MPTMATEKELYTPTHMQEGCNAVDTTAWCWQVTFSMPCLCMPCLCMPCCAGQRGQRGQRGAATQSAPAQSRGAPAITHTLNRWSVWFEFFLLIL